MHLFVLNQKTMTNLCSKFLNIFFRLLSYEILKLIDWIPEENKGNCLRAHLNDWPGAIEQPAICEKGINFSTYEKELKSVSHSKEVIKALLLPKFFKIK